MDNFNFYSPTEFIFGNERENETGKYVKKYSGNRALISYGSDSAVRSGLIDKIKRSLDKEDDIPLLVKNQGVGCGKTGGFMPLSEEDITKIYNIAAKAEI